MTSRTNEHQPSYTLAGVGTTWTYHVSGKPFLHFPSLSSQKGEQRQLEVLGHGSHRQRMGLPSSFPSGELGWARESPSSGPRGLSTLSSAALPAQQRCTRPPFLSCCFLVTPNCVPAPGWAGSGLLQRPFSQQQQQQQQGPLSKEPPGRPETPPWSGEWRRAGVNSSAVQGHHTQRSGKAYAAPSFILLPTPHPSSAIESLPSHQASMPSRSMPPQEPQCSQKGQSGTHTPQSRAVPAGVSPSWQKTNPSLNRCPRCLGCNVKFS